MLKYPIPDHVLFEFKYFTREYSDLLRQKIKSTLLESNIEKPFPKMKNFYFKEREQVRTKAEQSSSKIEQESEINTTTNPNIGSNLHVNQAPNMNPQTEQNEPALQNLNSPSNIAHTLKAEETTTTLVAHDHTINKRFEPSTRLVNKHFCNLEFLFRKHLVVPEELLGDILEIFTFFIYFYDQIEGPDFELEELFLCLNETDYSALSHDIHISLINIYLKEYLTKQQISFEKENGMFFIMLHKIALHDRQQKALLRIFWPEFLKEILIRRLLDEESIEAEVDELLVEIQGLDLEEEPEPEKKTEAQKQETSKGNSSPQKIEEEITRPEDSKAIPSQPKEKKEDQQIQTQEPLVEEPKQETDPDKIQEEEPEPEPEIEIEKDPVALKTLKLYQKIKYTDLETYDQLPIATKLEVLLFLIDDMMDLSTMRENLQKKAEEVNSMISERTKKLASIKEMEAEIKAIHEKILLLEKETETEEKIRLETMINLDRKQLAALTQKINAMKGERNKLSRSIGKLENSIMKASRELRDLNKKIPLGIYSKKDLGKDDFGNRYMIFAFDQIRLFMMDKTLKRARVFTGNFEIVKDFLDKRGRQQKQFAEVLEKFVSLGILNQSKSVKFSTKIFGRNYFSVFDPVLDANKKLAEEKEEARKKAEELEFEVKAAADLILKQTAPNLNIVQENVIKIQPEPIKEEDAQPAPDSIQIENSKANTVLVNPEQKLIQTSGPITDQSPTPAITPQPTIQAAPQHSPIQIRTEIPIAPIMTQPMIPVQFPVKIPERPKLPHELLNLEHEMQMRLCGLDEPTSREFFYNKQNEHSNGFLNSMRKYSSMFEVKPGRSSSKAKQSKFHIQYWGGLLIFMMDRPLEKRASLRFFKDMLFYLERHFQEYLSLINSYWIEDEEFERDFVQPVRNGQDIEALKQILRFVNERFQACYTKTRIEPESEAEEQSKPVRAHCDKYRKSLIFVKLYISDLLWVVKYIRKLYKSIYI